MKRSIRRNFTLVELLVVIMLMGLLMLMALPAFNSILTGKKSTQAAQAVQSIIAFARAYAVANHTTTAVVFPTYSNLSGIKGSISKEAINACYRVAVVRKNGASYTFDAWLPDSAWEYLPSGIMIPCENTCFGENEAANWSVSFQDPQRVTNVPVGSVAVPATSITETVRAIIIKPTGQVVTGGSSGLNYSCIRFIEGTYDAGKDDGTFIIKGGELDGTDAKNVTVSTLRVNPLTGKAMYLSDEANCKVSKLKIKQSD